MTNNRALGIADNGNIGDVLVKGELLEDGVPTGTTADQQTAWASPAEITQSTAQRAFAARLASTMPAVMTIVGDSTGNDDTEWPRLLANKLGTRYPARTVQVRTFRDATKDYGPSAYAQVGTAGQGYLNATGGGIGTPDGATKSLTTCDVLIRARLRLTARTAAAEQTIVGQYGGSGQNSYWIYFTPAGGISMAFSADGTTPLGATLATAGQAAAAIPLDTDVILQFSIQRTNGTNCVIKAEVSTDDGATFSLVGAINSSNSPIAGLFNSTSDVTIGCLGTASYPFLGRMYWVEAWKALTTAGTLAYRFDASLWNTGGSFVDAEANTWTLRGTGTITAGAPVLLVLNGSVAGAEVDYCTTNIATLGVATTISNLAIVNLGHNGEKTFAQYRTFVELVKTTLPSAAVVVTRQAPAGTASASYARSERQVILLAELAALNAYSVIDAYSAFKATGNPDALLLAPDDVHPNAAGSALWASTAARTFGIAA